MFASKDVFLTPPATGGYTIGKSVRLRSSASAYLNRTFGTPTNNLKWTFSAWIKRGAAADTTIFSQGIGATNTYAHLYYSSTGELNFRQVNGSGTTVAAKTTSSLYRDYSAWYHVVLVYDSANATSTNRLLLYVNGVQITAFSTSTDPSLSLASYINSAASHKISSVDYSPVLFYFDGYLTEINFIDGQALTPSSFGSTNSTTGVWQPAKYTGTYGTNGFYLNFSDNSAVTTSSNVGIGKDFSGNGNYWTSNNINVTAYSGSPSNNVNYDSMTDVPTLTSATAANYAVLNPLAYGSTGTSTLNNGNLSFANGAAHASTTSTIGVTSGKYYLECTVTTSNPLGLGITTSTTPFSAYPGTIAGLWWVYDNTGGWTINNQTTSPYSGASKVALNQIWQIALDMDNGKAWIGINNTFYDSSGGTTGNPSTGANPTWSSLPTTSPMYFFVEVAGAAWAATFGQRPFSYTAPTGYVALNTYNLPTSTITNGAKYMAATLYTGNGTSQTIANTASSASFQPDLIWTKSRGSAGNHSWVDSVRGTSLQLSSSQTTGDVTDATEITAITSTGFSVGNSTGAGYSTNASTVTYVGWQWKAGGTAVSNTSGSITSQVSSNTTAGFSIVTYTGNNTGGATVGHGCQVNGVATAPNMILVKARNSSTYAWNSYHSGLTAGYYIQLNTTAAQDNSVSIFPSGTVTSTVWNTGAAGSTVYNNGSGVTYVAYCFAAVKGFSAFGSYIGNGVTDGPFVYTGFRPRFIMAKAAIGTTGDWQIFDTSRNTYNVMDLRLDADATTSEGTFGSVPTFDALSNGFKLRSASGSINGSTFTFIYMAFAENPFQNALAR